MFHRQTQKSARATKINTLIGAETEIQGNVQFRGGLHIDGRVVGNIGAAEGTGAVLSLSEAGIVEGDIRVPNIVLNGQVTGDVYAENQIELLEHAKVHGSVYYQFIEIAKGAEINGNLVKVTASVAAISPVGGETDPVAVAEQK